MPWRSRSSVIASTCCQAATSGAAASSPQTPTASSRYAASGVQPASQQERAMYRIVGSRSPIIQWRVLNPLQPSERMRVARVCSGSVASCGNTPTLSSASVKMNRLGIASGTALSITSMWSAARRAV